MTNLFFAFEVFGTIVFAISGALSAGRKELDISGVIVIACLVGNGGGTIRDLLLGATPVFWIGQPIYMLMAAGSALVVFLLFQYIKAPYRSLLIADALGLGIFTIVGIQKTLALSFSPSIAVLMGVLTGVGGGLIRDVLCGEIPLILQREIYATAALAGAVVFVFLANHNGDNIIAGISCAFTVFTLRLAALRWQINLPRFKNH